MNSFFVRKGKLANIKICIDDIIVKCLYLTFLVTSYSAYIPSNIIDDIIIAFIGILLLVKIIKKGFFDYKLLISFSIILLETILAIVSFNKYSNNTINSYVNFIKIYILLMLTFYIDLENESKRKILKNFVILSIPNLLLGLLQFFQTQILGMTLGGKYEIIGGEYFYRIQGGTGHPLYYAFIMLALIIYFLYNSKFQYKNIMTGICLILCFLTYSSFASIIAIGIIVFKILSKNKKIVKMIQKHTKIYVILVIVLSLIFIYKFMLNETNTIRYVSTIGTLQSINFNSFIFGRGFGSYLSANYAEAYIFRLIYENGIIGLLAMVLVMHNIIVIQIRKKDFASLFVCSIFILNCVINEGYMTPYIILMPIFCYQTIIDKEKTLNLTKIKSQFSKYKLKDDREKEGNK